MPTKRPQWYSNAWDESKRRGYGSLNYGSSKIINFTQFASYSLEWSVYMPTSIVISLSISLPIHKYIPILYAFYTEYLYQICTCKPMNTRTFIVILLYFQYRNSMLVPRHTLSLVTWSPVKHLVPTLTSTWVQLTLPRACQTGGTINFFIYPPIPNM